MDAALIGSLVVLAVIDSTSFGTFLIPIWMMLAPGRLQSARLLVYLATVAVFYLVIGVVLLFGAAVFLDDLRPALESRPFQVAQLVFGIGLLGFALVTGRRRPTGDTEPGRLVRWRERAMTGQASSKALIGLALAAVTLEAATMLPYLAAIGLLGAAALTLPARIAILAGYCVVMILPALVLLAARLGVAERVQPMLVAVNRWMARNAANTTAWVVGILGFLFASDAARQLELFEALSKAI